MSQQKDDLTTFLEQCDAIYKKIMPDDPYNRTISWKAIRNRGTTEPYAVVSSFMKSYYRRDVTIEELKALK